MKYARDAKPSLSSDQTAQLLFEALPWIKSLTGRTVVIKYGGAAMVDAKLRSDVMSDILLLKIIGARIVIVHGGGAAINEALKHYDLPVEFKDGQRVTTPEAMEIVREVLVGKVNQELVAAINQHGNVAVGVSGSDAGTIVAEQLDPGLGRVGRVTRVNADYLESLMDNDYIPVVATVAQGEDGGFFNINADVAAGAVAKAVHAHKIIYLTDVDGLYEDFSDKLSSSRTSRSERPGAARARRHRQGHDSQAAIVRGGALRGRVFRAHIINSTMHSLLLELLTDTGLGAVMHSTMESYEQDGIPTRSARSRRAWRSG